MEAVRSRGRLDESEAGVARQDFETGSLECAFDFGAGVAALEVRLVETADT